MNPLAPISSNLTATVSALKKAGEVLRQDVTTNAKVDAMLIFRTELDTVVKSGQDQLEVWSRICSFRPWEGLLDVLAEAPKLTDYEQHENEIVLRCLCAISAGILVLACETYLSDNSATAYLSARLPKILQHQAWLSINTKQWKDGLHRMRQSTLHLIRAVLAYEKSSENPHKVTKRLDREMYLSLIFSHVVDPRTYTEKRDDEDLADVVEVLLAIGFDYQLSERAASWAATEFGPSSVCAGFFKLSQLTAKSKRESYIVAPLGLAVHLLASADNQDSMIEQHVVRFCINIYWSTVRQPNGGAKATGYFSTITNFIHVVLEIVEDPLRQATLIYDLIKEADFITLLGHMWLQWESDNDTLVAKIGKHIATLAAQDPVLTQEYIKPAWLHVQRHLESGYRIRTSSHKVVIRVLDHWSNFGRQLGWTATPDAFLLTDESRESKIVGCSWMRCPLYGEPGRLPAKTTLRMSRCRRCSQAQYCSLACQKSDWSLGDHRKKCGKRGKISQIQDLALLKPTKRAGASDRYR